MSCVNASAVAPSILEKGKTDKGQGKKDRTADRGSRNVDTRSAIVYNVVIADGRHPGRLRASRAVGGSPPRRRRLWTRDPERGAGAARAHGRGRSRPCHA